MDVTPDKQNIDKVFSNTTYYIDFYQRQYKWSDEPVKRLLDDIFYKFNGEYVKFKDSDIPLEKEIDKYAWYYLNTYVTNHVEGKLYLVDGQQRLTTLTLILIKLIQLTKHFKSDLSDWINAKIAGTSGFKKEFWMNHEHHGKTLKDLLSGRNPDSIDTSGGVTPLNMVQNYKVISDYLDRELNEKKKFESFVFYLLKRLVLINLNVEQTDVPMVFEVINDRGVRLKSYEILKGKLLGEIDKEELNELNLNELWDGQVNRINSYREDEIDTFFTYFLRSKFADTIGEARKFDKDYHRVLLTEEINKKLDLLHNPTSVKAFLRNEFLYYTNLYRRVLGFYFKPENDFIHVHYNYLTEMDSQFLLTLSACSLNDPQEDDKIRLIAYEVDRLFCLLHLQRSYDSNDFNTAIYEISSKIREKGIETIRPAFDEQIFKLIKEARGVETTEPFNFGLFKEIGIELNKRFKRYFFARIEQFLADNTNMKMKHSFADLVTKTGSVTGFHIEHILAQNAENLKAFKGDQENFERERNRLGGLLLLKGRDNESSGKEPYKKKLKTYANTLYWNETLREDTYKSKLDFSSMMKKYNLKFRHMDIFGQDELEERHRLLFDMMKIIWK